jgi:hypothetical protein
MRSAFHPPRFRPVATACCLALAFALLSLVPAQPVRAEQYVLVDIGYTHSAETTKDSHYYPKLPADIPKDWTKPIDYAHGEVHIVLDVKTKPAGDAPTKYQLCFEGTPSYGCSAQSPTYTKPGRVEWSSPFSGFWYDSTVDWTQGIKEMPMILKDDMNNKPAGDAKYVPTELHVYVALVSAGSKFVAPPAAGSGGSAAVAGSSGARAGAGGNGSKPDAGRGGAGSGGASDSPSGGAGARAVSGGSGASKAESGGAGAAAVSGANMAGKAADVGSGGSAGKATGSTASGQMEATSPALMNNAGCSATGAARVDASWAFILAAWFAWSRRRVQQRCSH